MLRRTAVAVLNHTVIARGKELYNSCAGSLQQPHAIDQAFYLAVLQVRGLHFCWGQQPPSYKCAGFISVGGNRCF